VFVDLPAGVYTISETQPLAFYDGHDTLGTPQLGHIDNDRFVDLLLAPGTAVIEYNFGERGLIAELVTLRMFLSSAPSPAQFLAELDVMAGTWHSFQAAVGGILHITAEDGEGVGLEVYSADMMPLAIGQQDTLTLPVTTGESYVLHVDAEAQMIRLWMTIQEDVRQCGTNPGNALDVNGDGYVSPLDALTIINELNDSERGTVTDQVIFCDVNGDGYTSPLGVLTVIRHLNQGFGGEAEGEAGVASDSMSSEAKTIASIYSEVPFMTRNLLTPAPMARAIAVSTPATGSPIPPMVMSDARSLAPTAAGQAMSETEYTDIVESGLIDNDVDLLLPELESILQDILGEVLLIQMP
jgi:hypothetical protein